MIINPHASHARKPEARAAIAAILERVLLERDGVAPRIEETTGPDETAPLVRAALDQGAPSVVGVGGDGTLREIASVLRGTGVPLGIIPAGTGNQVASVLRIPTSPESAAKALAGFEPRTIDLGEVTLRRDSHPETTSLFTIGCGSGFDARLMATTPSHWKDKLGKVAYMAQAVRLATDLRPMPCRITVDAEILDVDATIALVGNMGQVLPGVIDLRLPIDPADGYLDLIVVTARGPIHGLRGLFDQLTRTAEGGESGAESIRLRGRHISIVPAEPAPLEVDGDYVGEGGFSARILPAALEVLAPARSNASATS